MREAKKETTKEAVDFRFAQYTAWAARFARAWAPRYCNILLPR